MFLPFVVGKRVDFLLKNGRRFEALALLNIDWNQGELERAWWDNMLIVANSQIVKMSGAFYDLSKSMGEKLIPSLKGLAGALSEIRAGK